MQSKSSVETIFLKTDVTAISFFKEKYILAGVGKCLFIYRVSDSILVYNSPIFQGQRIHGIVKDTECPNNVAIFGGKEIKVIDIIIQEDSANEQLSVSDNLNKYFSLDDWIISLIWTENSQISALTAHNVVKVCDVNTGCIQRTQYSCEEKCILYSGSLFRTHSDLIVLSGTAFSQICIWSTHGEDVYHRLTGHKGVIFSVSFDRENQTIASTSDDRSIRVWSISCHIQDCESLQYWRESNIHLKCTLFGHTARVMQHKYVGSHIISIAEDTVMCVWDLDGHLIGKRKVCPSGALWCVDSDGNKVVIGGSDGGITMLPFNQIEPLPKALDFRHEQLTAKRVVLTNRGNVVCVTEEGNVMYYNICYNTWQHIHTIQKDKSYLCVSLCKQFVAVVGLDGHLDIFVESCKNLSTLSHFISQDLKTEDKILSVQWVYDRCLVICDAKGLINVLGANGIGTCTNIMSFEVPKSKQRWLTAAALDGKQKQLLIVGDRCGNVHMFKKGSINAIQSINKLHGNIGVTTIEICGERVITAGRNGVIKIMILKTLNNIIRLTLLYNIKAPFDWIENFLDKDRNIVCGFKETNLNIWNIKTQSNIVDVNCGGGHRSWDSMKSWLKNKEGQVINLLRLVYIKNSKVMLLNMEYNDVEPKRLSYCYHSRDINCCKVIGQSDTHYYISGGENTNINISSCSVKNKECDFEDLSNIYNHLSNIRCMCLVECDEILEGNVKKYYLYSGGGRAQLCSSMIELTEDNMNSYDLASYMLKGTDLEKKKKKSKWSNVETDVEVETRFMSLNCLINKYIDSNEHFHILFAGCSDGYLRLFKISYNLYDDCNIDLIGTIDYHKKCILNVHSFKIKDKIIGISLAVDGTVAFWDFSSYNNITEDELLGSTPLFTKRIHKAGINAFDFKMTDENTFILATGGDDNTLHLNIFKYFMNDDNLIIEDVHNWSSDKYHCSQITGVAFCENNLIITASIDQRITVIRWKFDSNISCDYVTQYCCSIPSVQGLNVVQNNGISIRVCVFGKGLEIVDITPEKL